MQNEEVLKNCCRYTVIKNTLLHTETFVRG